VERLGQILGREGVFRKTQTLEEIWDAAREFRRGKIDILVIDGGDGTLHHTLSAFIPIYSGMDLPPIVLLRGGTMNTIAQSLGMKGISEVILERIISATRGRAPFEVVRANTLRVNDRYGFIFGLGFPVKLLKAYYRGHGRGRWKTIRVLLKIVFSMVGKGGADGNLFHPFEAEVKEVGLGFKPTRRAGEREGLFQILCCDMGPKRMGLTALKILLDMELRDSKLFDRMVTRSVITLEKPVDMQMDGEIFEDQKEICLHVGPAIRFIRTWPSS
jgi:diacylglycerol kinase family enzyme